MPLQKHPLDREFPEHAERLRELCQDGHFQHLYEEYERLDERIYRIESGREAHDHLLLLGLKLQRVALKDELLERLRTVP